MILTARSYSQDPFWLLQEELNRLIDGVPSPELDLYEGKDTVMVRLNMPGMKKEDIELSIQDGVLSIRGKKTRSHDAQDKGLVCEERVFGAFARSLALPEGVDAEQVKASYRNGVLEITVPKREEAKPKAISVQVK